MQETLYTGIRCSHASCGALNRPAARYCAVCGRRIRHARTGTEAIGKSFALVLVGALLLFSAVTCAGWLV